MTTIAAPMPAISAGSALGRLAGVEIRRYARHPLFLIGVVLSVVATVPDKSTTSFFNAIAPAAGLGILGLVAMAGMARNAQRLARSAGATPVPESTQTGALALAALLPFSVGLLWFAWSVYVFHHYATPASGFPFGGMTEGWKWGVLFGEVPMAALGGPLLGLLIGRWWPRRGVAPICAVLLVAFVIVFQGLFEPLRRTRLFAPWTYFGGPFGTNADPNRVLIFNGSPQWWVAYLACLCGLAVVGALWHTPEARTPRLRAVGVALIAVAVATYVLATLTGVPHTLVNPAG